MAPNSSPNTQGSDELVRVRVIGPSGSAAFDDSLPVLARLHADGFVAITLGRRTGTRVLITLPIDVLVDIPDAVEAPEKIRERAEASFYARVELL